MRRNRMTGVAAAVMALGLVSVPAYSQSGAAAAVEGGASRTQAQEPGPGRAARRLGVLRRLTDPELRDRLGLTAEQSGRLDALLFESAKRVVQRQADLKLLRLEMLEQMKAENPDRAVLESKIDEIGAARSNLARIRLDAFFEIRDLLTPEQRDLLRESLRKGGNGARRRGRKR